MDTKTKTYETRKVIKNGRKVVLKETDKLVYHVMCVPIPNSKNSLTTKRKVEYIPRDDHHKVIGKKKTKTVDVTLYGIQAALQSCANNKLYPILSTDGYLYIRAKDLKEVELIRAAVSLFCRCSVTAKPIEEVIRDVTNEKKPSNNTTEAKQAARESRKKKNKRAFADRLLRKGVRMKAEKYRSFKKSEHTRGVIGSPTTVEVHTAQNAKKAVMYIEKKEKERISTMNNIKAKQIKFNAMPKQQTLKFAA